MAETSQATAVRNTTLNPSVADVFRGLWVSLFYSGRDVGKTVLVCSSGAGEGASTIATALALAGGESSGLAKVALVDFNLRDPSAHNLLGLKLSPGVRDILARDADIDSVVQRVNGSLDVFSQGNGTGKPIDILRNDRIGPFFARLNELYDHVVVDVAPVNEYPDAQALAGTLGSVLLVAQTDRTPREAIVQARKRLEAGGGKLVGTVLNMRTYPIPRFLYHRV